MKKNDVFHVPECAHNLLAVRDTIDVLSGKWVVPIISTFRLYRNLHFKDLHQRLPGISAKVLAANLREMEINMLISRTVKDTKPVKVEYELTTYGATLMNVMFEMLNWGLSHRAMITGKNPLSMSASNYT